MPTAKPRSTTWKIAERFIAKAFGVDRSINNGKAKADVEIPGFSVESKKVKKIPALLTNAMAQARRNTIPGKFPLLVIYQPQSGPGTRTERLVVMDFADFVTLHGKAYGTADTAGIVGIADDLSERELAGADTGAATDQPAGRRVPRKRRGGTAGHGDSGQPQTTELLGGVA